MNKTSWKKIILDSRRVNGVTVRQKTYVAIREHFLNSGLIEVETPILVTSPGMETHIRPWELKTDHHDLKAFGHRLFLHTSPEFSMKKLLAGGLENIFQICKVFRFEPKSPNHHPEFTMLEWYRTQACMETIMQDVESLIESLAIKINGASDLLYQNQTISFKSPWPRFRVNDLFKEFVQIDLAQNLETPALASHCKRLGILTSEQENANEHWDDLYFKIWLNCIEPKLPKNYAFFVTHYPGSMAALAKTETDSNGVPWALRFEVYAAGLELANAFQELTDPVEQRKRFESDMSLRRKTYGDSFPVNPIDESFIRALQEGLPPCSGIALGVDRLIMLLANENDINYTVWLVPFEPNK